MKNLKGSSIIAKICQPSVVRMLCKVPLGMGLIAAVCMAPTRPTHADTVGFELTVSDLNFDISEAREKYELENISSSARITGITLSLNSDDFVFDCVVDLLGPTGGVITVNIPVDNNCFNHDGIDSEFDLGFSDFDPNELASWTADIDPPHFNNSPKDVLGNAVVSVNFSDGNQIVASFPDAPIVPGAENSFTLARSIVVPVVVAVDIKPGADPNSINLCSKGTVPIALLGSNTFDVANVDTELLRFAEAAVKVVGKKDPHTLCSYDDVNGDLIDDLVCHFVTSDIAGIDGESTSATVNGELYDSTPIEGVDDINIVKDTCN